MRPIVFIIIFLIIISTENIFQTRLAFSEWRGGHTHWEQHDWHSQSDSSEHSQSDAEDQRVIGVNAAVSVQQLWLHVACGCKK